MHDDKLRNSRRVLAKDDAAIHDAIDRIEDLYAKTADLIERTHRSLGRKKVVVKVATVPTINERIKRHGRSTTHQDVSRVA